MKQTIFVKIISTFLILATLLGSTQLTMLTAFAAESGASTSSNDAKKDAEKKLTPGEALLKEMAARAPIKKDRSAISSGSQAAVYVDGALYKEGDFSPMWNVAMDKAAFVEGSNSGRSTNVEYVLNKDFRYDSSWFSEKTMTVDNKIFTIDLNGHALERFDNNGSVIIVKGGSELTIMDSNPDREIAGNKNSEGKWIKMSGGSVKIKGGVITGGYLKTGDGGGLNIYEKSIVHMTGGTIAGNKADVGSGVHLDDESVLDMSVGNAQICYNTCSGTTTDGGAVFLRTGCSMAGGFVHHNVADDYGGGVRAKGGKISICDVAIYANRAEEYGGGLYIERTGTGQIVTVSGCKVIENYAPEGGGGAYTYDLNRTNLIDCVFEENWSDENGGGICVNCATGTDLSVSGKMTVRNNYEKRSNKKIPSNLYLAGDDDLLVEGLAMGSEIWIKTGIAPADYNGISKPITGQTTNTSAIFFYSDVDGYYVKYQDNPGAKNFRHLYLEKGSRTVGEVKLLNDYATKELEQSYKIESGALKGEPMPLYKGYFEFNMMSTSDYYSASPFYYSDGYFFEDPTYYNPHLATMSINLSLAAFGRYTDQVGDNSYANHFANVKQLFSDIGCLDVNFFANEDYQMKPAYYGEDGRLSTIAVAISQKEINNVNGESFTLVPIAIRGAGYETEWSSNVSIGKNGEAKGFADAADQVYGHVQNYIANYGLTEEAEAGKVKFWVVGYSRAGATANLTSKRLIDNFASKGNQTFGYTFEAPMGGVDSAIEANEYNGNGAYPTIHNTVNENDFVTFVAPADMGFKRYGVDHLVGSDHKNGNTVNYDTTSTYYVQRMRMTAQLRAITPYYNFDDSWEVADVNIILGNLPIFATDMIDKGKQWNDDPNPESMSISTFLPWFFTMVVGDGLMLPTKEVPDPADPDKTIVVFDTEKAREKYSEAKPLANIAGNNKSADGTEFVTRNLGYSEMSIEQAAASLVSLMMGELTDEQMDKLLSAAMVNGGVFKDHHFTVHKWEQSLFESIVKHTGIGLAPIGAIASFIYPIASDLSHIFDIYDEIINDWDIRSELEKSNTVNMLMHGLLDGSSANNSRVWDILTEEQAETVAQALPVVIWFALNYASRDYNDTDDDDGMWGLGTFVNNASVIISNHYQEVSLAWVRSYDDFYKNDLQAYTLDTANIVNDAPTGSYASSTKTLTLKGQEGSSIFYSIDGGNSWSAYMAPVDFEETPDEILCFSIYRGVKSEVNEVSLNAWTGSILGGGNVWFLIAGAVLVVGACVAAVEINRKKKKAAESSN